MEKEVYTCKVKWRLGSTAYEALWNWRWGDTLWVRIQSPSPDYQSPYWSLRLLILEHSANLSTDYFTNRQDRYHLFSDKNITDYYARIQQAVSQISYKVLPDKLSEQGYKLIWPASNPAPQPTERPQEFKASASALLGPLLWPSQQPEDGNIDFETESTDTVVYPLGQFTPLFQVDTSTEIVGLSKVLQLLTRPDFYEASWTFTAGYFNIHPTLKSILLASTSKQGSVITAHPHANGFFGSSGISGNLPPGYTLLASRFLADVYAAGKQNTIILKEWKRGIVGEKDGWTYHAKGKEMPITLFDNPGLRGSRYLGKYAWGE